MIDDLGGVTTSLVRLALDAALLRHKVIANNIANAKTPEFRPQFVSFEKYLSQAVRSVPGPEEDRRIQSEIDTIAQRLKDGELVQTRNGVEVQVDQEMARLSANTVQYQALLEGFRKRSDLIRMAITGQGGR